jgi:hypothetical protein
LETVQLASGLKEQSMAPREQVEHLEPDVVPGPLVLGAGVAESNNEFHEGPFLPG